MAMFPMERGMYSWMAHNTTRSLNVTFFPSSPEGSVYSWLDVNGWSDSTLALSLRNMSLAALALMALQEAPASKPRTVLPPLRRLLGRFRLSNVILVNVLKTLVGLVLMLASLPVMLPLLVFFWVTSLLARLSYTLWWGASVKKVQGLDCVWGVEEKESKPFIIACLLVHGAPNLHSVQQTILTKVLEVPDVEGGYKYHKLRQLFSQHCGYYCWKDDPQFEIENHVREVQLSHLSSEVPARDGSSSDGASGHKEECEARSEAADELVQRFMSEQLTVAMPENMSPWEVLLVARDDGRYNVVLRIHHAIGDGVTLVRLCTEALVDTPLPPLQVGAPPPSRFVRAACMLWSLTVLPLGLMKVVANFDHNCLHGPALSGRKVMTWSKGMQLSLLRQVKAATSTTINDVLMTCLSASIARHFARRKEDTQKVTVVVPVSFHDLRAPLTLTNLFSIATVKLPVANTLTPPARLAAVKEVMDATKKDPTLWAVYFLVKAVSEVLPAPVAAHFFSSRGLTLAASNVPGPQQEITIWGDEVEDLVFWVPNRGPVGVGVSFFSYRGVVKVGLNVDLALVHSKEEAQQLLEDMEEELRLLDRHLLPQAN